MLVGLAILGLSIGGLLGRHQAPAPPAPAPVVSEAARLPAESGTETVAVHVSGMVMSPGVVDVPADSIVADVIDAAGGLLPTALIDRINLAAPVSAGDHIMVPGPGGGDDGNVASAASGDGLISLNTASATELERLPGVGPVLAGRIVSFRDQNGRFNLVEDLLEVPGIGEAKLAALRDLVKP